jgi:hypothetical protein
MMVIRKINKTLFLHGMAEPVVAETAPKVDEFQLNTFFTMDEFRADAQRFPAI